MSQDIKTRLLNYQQHDSDGVMVVASRQAIHEAADRIEALERQLAKAKERSKAKRDSQPISNSKELETSPWP